MVKIIQKRFEELSNQLSGIAATMQVMHSDYSGRYEQVDPEQFLNWCVKARSLIGNACGREAEHYKSFVAAEEPLPYSGNYENLKNLRAVFTAAREDFEGGYLISVRNLVQAEIAESELEQAKELNSSGYTSAAAVVAGVVMETIMRTLCDSQGIPHGKLDKMNADLAKAGQYNSLVQKRITALAAIRNSAAHGKAGDFTAADVSSMITDVERFAEQFLP